MNTPRIPDALIAALETLQREREALLEDIRALRDDDEETPPRSDDDG